jgi:hypothetical protein
MEARVSRTRQRWYPLAVCVLLLIPATAHAQTHIAADLADPRLRFAAEKLADALAARGATPSLADLSASERADVMVLAGARDLARAARAGIALPSDAIGAEGFRVVRVGRPRSMVAVVAPDATGAMYGILDVAEQVRMRGRLDLVAEKSVAPRLSFRAVKFNLPWSPYRGGPATEQHLAVARDLAFWRRFLDMMAENRFNALTLWNLHPFPYMIRSARFPEASTLSDAELVEWRAFWKSLFRMAKERGIETYVVNWNIVVSPAFAKAHRVAERNDTSEIVRRYTRESVAQMIDEYEDLTGVGVTLADWMTGMTPKAREDWIEQTVVAGMKAAKRPVKFIHRSVLAGSPAEMRRVIDAAKLPDTVHVEIKFNWSHGHSTPRLGMTHDYESGRIDDGFWNPRPSNYAIEWMIRNEDFFILRWGEPGFIREHLRTNVQPYVDGYFVGSEGFIPAADYSHAPSVHRTWQYAFEKQWLFYMEWGRLLYDPATSDGVFAAAFDERYGAGIGTPLLTAYTLASRMPLRLASFHAATWDYTLYSEGFLAPARSRGAFDGVSPFISILELIDHQTLDPTYLSIPAFVSARARGTAVPDSMMTPLALADASERDSRGALASLDKVRQSVTPFSGALECEVLDVSAWAHLGLYFADKLRAGVALETFRQTGDTLAQHQAVATLERAVAHWDDVIAATTSHYRPTPHVFMEDPRLIGGLRDGFTWSALRDQVQRDVELARTATRTPTSGSTGGAPR